jgi:hypothetical protein
VLFQLRISGVLVSRGLNFNFPRGGWFPTSGIAGKLTYTSYDESWTFEVSFRNDLIGNIRRCRVNAYPASDTDENSTEPSCKSKQFWQISKGYEGIYPSLHP